MTVGFQHRKRVSARASKQQGIRAPESIRVLRTALRRTITLAVVAALPSTAMAAVSLHVTPQQISVGLPLNLEISLTSTPGTSESIGGIAFAYEPGSKAWNALNPSEFHWIPEEMSGENLLPGWFVTEELPDPAAVGFTPNDVILVPDGQSILFATLTVTPSETGLFSFASNANISDGFGFPIPVSEGDPVTITVVIPEPATLTLLCLPLVRHTRPRRR